MDDRIVEDYFFLQVKKREHFTGRDCTQLFTILQLRIIPPSLIDAGADGGAISRPR